MNLLVKSYKIQSKAKCELTETWRTPHKNFRFYKIRYIIFPTISLPNPRKKVVVWRSVHSPQSTSAPPDRLRRSWQRTARATPSQQLIIRAAPADQMGPQCPAHRFQWHRRGPVQTDTMKRLRINNNSSNSPGDLVWSHCSFMKYASYCSLLPWISRESMRGVTLTPRLRITSLTLTCSFIRHTCGFVSCGYFYARLDLQRSHSTCSRLWHQRFFFSIYLSWGL